MSAAKFVDSDFLLEWGKLGNGLEIKTLSIKRVVLSSHKGVYNFYPGYSFSQHIHTLIIFF